ncbi:HAMP domain-containing histidine kinase [Vibrio sp. S4M6]|uniref:sensor histidine kinase n=1 Tax=Vibrio sinus TaxID=2946865 RepID=UPI00202A5EB2|nr:HAMP domain-containing sensor histidine kinase [Vibrio sinus]MCL9782730.1 HAMP domain-containing histidine kinase [Vibrio sinus]
MPFRPFYNTSSLSGRLAAFFTFVALAIGLMTFVIFIFALQWSEDRAGERMLLVDRDEAIYKFTHGDIKPGVIKIDILTKAYNNIASVPEPFRDFVKKKDYYLGEVGFDSLPTDHMVYVGHYYVEGKKIPLVLITEIDRIEFGFKELAYAGSIVLVIVLGLMLIFGIVLNRLSRRLISPLNDIHFQLEQHGSNLELPFTMSEEAAQEFHTLIDKMNGYREQVHSMLVREKAFARYASHELRTPLTVVKGASKLLSRGEIDEFQSRQVDRLNDASTQMETMVDALLSLVRYEKSEDLSPEREFRQQELEKIIQQNSAQAVEKGLSIQLSVDASPIIRATAPVMNMLIGNLLRNAIAATEQGQISVKQNSQLIAITDQGHGLSSTPNKDGHGLGLLIVDDLCRRYQWDFSLTEHPKGGCIATIRFESESND